MDFFYIFPDTFAPCFFVFWFLVFFLGEGGGGMGMEDSIRVRVATDPDELATTLATTQGYFYQGRGSRSFPPRGVIASLAASGDPSVSAEGPPAVPSRMSLEASWQRSGQPGSRQQEGGVCLAYVRGRFVASWPPGTGAVSPRPAHPIPSPRRPRDRSSSETPPPPIPWRRQQSPSPERCRPTCGLLDQSSSRPCL